MADRFLREAVASAALRRNPDQEAIDERNAYLGRQSDWFGTCHFCKKKITGTIADLKEHSCPEYEASRGPSS